MTEDNNSLGKFHLDRISPSPRGLRRAWCSPTTLLPKSSSLWQKHSAELVVLSSLHTENHCANELGRRIYVTGEMWNDKSPFRLAVNLAGV